MLRTNKRPTMIDPCGFPKACHQNAHDVSRNSVYNASVLTVENVFKHVPGLTCSKKGHHMYSFALSKSLDKDLEML